MATDDSYRQHGVDLETFQREFQNKRRPVVLVGDAQATEPVRTWTPEWIRDHHGDVTVSMQDHGERDIPLGKYIDMLLTRETTRKPMNPTYLRNIFIHEQIPALAKVCSTPPMAVGNHLTRSPLKEVVPDEWSQWLEFFVSGSGLRYPDLHADTHHTHAWLMQVSGKKKIWLWPPLGDSIEERVWHNANVVETVAPNTLLSIAFKHAKPIKTHIAPGDVAFIPAGWWHTTETEGISITLSGNFVNQSNWEDFLAFCRLEVDDNNPERPTLPMAREVMRLLDEGAFPKSFWMEPVQLPK